LRNVLLDSYLFVLTYSLQPVLTLVYDICDIRLVNSNCFSQMFGMALNNTSFISTSINTSGVHYLMPRVDTARHLKHIL